MTKRCFRAFILLMLLIPYGLTLAQDEEPEAQDFEDHLSISHLFCDLSPFNTPISFDAIYQIENRIGSFRQNEEVWSTPIYRIPADDTIPQISIINNYSGRTEFWRIPIDAEPALESDHHMAVIYENENTIYEFWDAVWVDDETMKAGGMKRYTLNGDGITHLDNRRVTASGFAVTAGMVIREDFINEESGELDPESRIDHALSMSLNFDIVEQDGFITPAVGGEEAGLVTDGTGIPMGALFTISPEISDEVLAGYHPLTRVLAQAARDYGIYVNDTNGSPPYNDKYVGNIRIEPGLVGELYGIHNDELRFTIQEEMFLLIDQYGIYRVQQPGYPDRETDEYLEVCPPVPEQSRDFEGETIEGE